MGKGGMGKEGKKQSPVIVVETFNSALSNRQDLQKSMMDLYV